jgi:hypothetical protein
MTDICAPILFAILVLLSLNRCSDDQQHQEMMDKLHQIELKLNK